MFRCILAAVDGSTHANRALDEAIDLAQLSAARLTVMTVVPEPSTWMLGAGYGVPVAVDGLTDQVEHEYTTMLRGTVERVSDDIPVSTVVKRGSAGAAILRRRADGGMVDPVRGLAQILDQRRAAVHRGRPLEPRLVGTHADDEQAGAMLREPEVCGVKQSVFDAVGVGVTRGGGREMEEVFRYARARILLGRIPQARDNGSQVSDGVAEQQTTHVSDDERSGAGLGDRANHLRQQVAVIVPASPMPAAAERLTWGAGGEHGHVTGVIAEVDRADVARLKLARGLPAEVVGVVTQCLAARGVLLHEVDNLEAGLVKSERQSARAGEQLQRRWTTAPRIIRRR